MERASSFLPERKESDLTFPFIIKAAFGNEKYIFDSLGDWSLLVNFKDSGHWQSGGDALVNILLHRRHVMREQNAAFPRGPFEHFRIPSAGKPGILHAHDVEIRSAAQ